MTKASLRIAPPVAQMTLVAWAGAIVLACLLFLLLTQGPSLSTERLLALGIFAAVAAFLFFTSNIGLALSVLLLYLGLLDGFLKLRTGSELMTLARDVLLAALVAGVLLRRSRSERL